MSPDDILASIAESTGSYAGHFLGDDGRLHILLTDVERSDEVRNMVVNRFDQSLWSVARRGVIFVEALYRFDELKKWHDSNIDNVWANDGVFMTDIDEGNNKILVVVTNAGARAGVIEALANGGVPSDAVEVRVGEGAGGLTR